jgi:hypothetical protein
MTEHRVDGSLATAIFDLRAALESIPAGEPVTVLFEGHETSDGTPIEPMIQAHGFDYERTEAGFKLTGMRGVPFRGRA